MNREVLFLLLSAHMLADFGFQTHKLVELRYSRNLRKRSCANLVHSGIHLGTYLLFICYYWSMYTLAAILILSLTHFIVDEFKSWGVVKRPFLKHSILYFLFDQAVHFVLILIALSFINKNIIRAPFVNSFIGIIEDIFNQFAGSITYNEKVIFTLFLLLIGTIGVGALNRIVLTAVKLKPYKKAINSNIKMVQADMDNGTQNGGFIIGILERLLIIIVIVIGLKEVIGFALATKSIARFKKFDDDGFVETFIIGSFISFISAIVIGIIIKKLGIFAVY